jgi:type IV pilus assembly protein PilY1
VIKEVIPMKVNKISCCFIFLQLFLFAAHSFAADTDLYVGNSSSINPNILIVFDTSGSMNDQVSTGNIYDPAMTYPTHPDHTNIVATAVYMKSSSGNWFQPLSVFKNSIGEVACSTARTILTSKGTYIGRTNSTCTSTSRTLATGNYLNFYLANDGMVGWMKKIDIAKMVIKDFLDTISDVRIGVMRFGSITQSGYTDSDEGGRVVYDIVDLTDSNRSSIKDTIDNLSANGYTPLAEVLYEVGRYFKGGESYFNYKNGVKVQYTSPLEYYCQKNFVILMTDGISTQDRNSILNSIGDQDGDIREPVGAVNDPGFDLNGSDFLDDVVKYVYDNDLSTTFANKQNIVTYSIGFELDSSDPDNAPLAKDLLRRAATHGHGKFYTTSGTVGLANAFSNILNEVLANASSFVAPIVPVSKMERTTAGDKIYLAFFRPNSGKMWSGNIKKYGVQQTNDPSKGLVIGDLVDSSGSKALDSDGAFYPSTRSFWTTSSSDGGDVELGGVGELLKARTTARKIYTLLPGSEEDEDDGEDSDTSFDLTNSWNAFTTTNSRLTTSKLGVSTTEEKDNLINFVHGIDVYDDNVNGSTTDKRDWFLGSFLHSRPHIVHYADRTVIYAGANDGMLHAFDDASGEELWAFVPPCLLGRLTELHTETPGIFVDGSPKAYVSYDSDGVTVNKAILIFGLRRGGNYYYALDVTNPIAPKYLWRIYQNKGGVFKELGQTWSTPVIGKVAYGTGEKWVAIFGGGYDTGQDEENPVADDIGRGIYIADVLTGSFVRGMSYSGGETAMTYSIPSDVAPIDLNGDGKIDRVYVGDMNSRMWRVDLGDVNKDGSSDPGEWTVKKIFQPDTAEKRKTFYPPDVTFEKDSSGEYEMLFFGTGDREDPKEILTIKDRLYALKDKNYSGTLTKTDLVDVTSFYEKTTAEQTAMLNNIQSNYGWYIQLGRREGEKCLATPVVYNKTAYFTSFSPSSEAIGDPCFVGEGTAMLYALNYATGEAVFNFDDPTDLGVGAPPTTGSDRSTIIGTAIPSGVVVTVIGGRVTAYIGVGGGVYKPTLTSTRSLFPMHWKLVF